MSSQKVKVRSVPTGLERANLKWQGPAAMAAAGVGATAMADGSMPMLAAGVGSMGGSLVAMLTAWRHREREELAMVLAGSLSPEIGRLPWCSVRGSRWVGWGSRGAGRPKKLVIRYDPAVDSAAPGFTEQICARLENRLGIPYRVARHQQARCRLVLTVDRSVFEPAAVEHPAVERAAYLVSELLGAEATWTPRIENGELQAIEVRHRIGVQLASNPLKRTRVEKTFNTAVEGRWRAKWDLEKDTVLIERRPEIPDKLPRNLGPVGQEDLTRLPYAVDEDSNVLAWDLDSSAATPHFMTIGSTGTGKTNLIRTLITEASRRGWCLRLCDPKRIEFAGFRGWPNVETVATAVPDIVAVIHQTWLEMERRYKLIEAGKADTDDFPRLILVLDEYRYFYGVVNDWYAEVKGTGGSKICPILGEVFLIASLGRSAKVNIVLGTQRPDAAWLGGDVRDQFMARASLGRLSRQGADMLWGSPSIGVSVPRGKAGRGTSVGPDGSPAECQAFWTPDPRSKKASDIELLEALMPESTSWEPYVVVPPPELDETGAPRDPKGRWSEYRDAAYEPLAQHPDLVMGSGHDLKAASSAALDAIEHAPEPEYLEPQDMPASSVAVGQLLCVDADTDLWGVVDAVSEDAADESQVLISWRADDGSDYGLLSVEDAEVLVVREQNEEALGVVNDEIEIDDSQRRRG